MKVFDLLNEFVSASRAVRAATHPTRWAHAELRLDRATMVLQIVARNREVPA